MLITASIGSTAQRKLFFRRFPECLNSISSPHSTNILAAYLLEMYLSII